MTPVRSLKTLIALAALLVVSTATAQTKIAVVDVQAALLQTEDGMRAANSLKRFTQGRQADLDKRQRDLMKEQDDLRKQARFLSRRSMARRTEHWQRRMVEVQTKFIEYNKQLQERQQNMMNPIMQKLFAAIRRAASQRGFDIVIDKSVAPYARQDLDLTDLVVQIYAGGGGGDAPPDDAKPDE